MTLLEQCMSLPLQERRILAMKVLDSCKGETEDKENRSRFLVEMASEVMGCPLSSVSRDYKSMMLRFLVANQMHLEGFSDDEIGKTLNRDRATVWYYLKRMKDMIEYPQSFKKEMNYLLQYQKSI